MRKISLLLVMACMYVVLPAQTLTVEKIMQDPRWIGTQPSSPMWSADGKYLYFKWNPDNNISDSNYRYVVATGKIEKAGYLDAALVSAMRFGNYNKARTKMVYAYNGDIYLYDTKSSATTRVTQTGDYENDPSFIMNDEWIAYGNSGNLFAWQLATGFTRQLTNFSSAEAGSTLTSSRGGSRGGGKSTSSTVAAKKKSTKSQERWLEENQLMTSSVLKERKEAEDAEKAYLKAVKDPDTLMVIKTGDKRVMNISISPNGNFVTYNLYTAPTPSKRIIVPNYITESGFTTDIPGRTKVGNNLGTYDLYIYDRNGSTVTHIATDSLPGIEVQPDYLKDYPGEDSIKRTISISEAKWNEDGSKAIIDIQSQDYKDRWVMLLDAVTGKLSLVDHQRDEAWIAGPGIGGWRSNSIGWISANKLYLQSEATGYSHLYTFDVTTAKKTALTSGKYEVQDANLSTDKKYFYLLTNEEHPGKQNWYRIDADGSNKQKITSMIGGYEVAPSPDEKFIAYRYSYMNKPWELYLQPNAAGKKAIQVTDKSMSDAWKAYPWREPEMVQIPARDGQTIYARLYEPEASKKNGAAVIFVHGAGYLQNVHYWWSSYFREYMFNNLLTDLGYTVIDADYRASSGYGRDWRTGIYRFMGGKDMTDNIDAINWLIKTKGIDANRVGMYGGSYGGFMTLMTMFTAPDVVKAGAALRPVTDWAHYNHGYTARILNEPFTDSIAYARSSPINFAAGLKNHLLICHGMVDVNVNFQDVVRLTQRLIELGKDDWEIAPYPMEDHGFVEPSSWTDEYKRILKLFNTNLLTK